MTRLKCFLFGLTLLCTLLLAPSATAYAHSVSNLDFIDGLSEDGARNYDFDDNSVDHAAVDWPVTLLFWGNAHIAFVKADLCYHGDLCDNGGESKYGRIDDDSPWAQSGCATYCWDTDTGKKTDPCGSVWGNADTDVHYRVYAPSGADRMYNTQWDYYVVATTHWDKHDSIFCDGTAQYGWSEQGEHVIYQKWTTWMGSGAGVLDSGTGGNNYQAPHWASGNYWDNDGQITRLHVTS